MMLRTQAEAIARAFKSGQNWFRPENKYACKVFGTIASTIGEECSCVREYNYLDVPKCIKFKPAKQIEVCECRYDPAGVVYDLASKIRSRVYAEAEELNSDDLELGNLDNIYQQAGLNRRRYIWLAYCKGKDMPVGAAIAYRAPLGLNLSLLENRCDLIVDDVEDSILESVCLSLIEKAGKAYFDNGFPMEYPLNFIPMIADERCADILIQHGAKLIRKYRQCIWLNDVFSAWNEHAKMLYKKVLEREKKKPNGGH